MKPPKIQIYRHKLSPRPRSKLKLALKILAVFLIASLAAFIILNFGSISKQASFFLRKHFAQYFDDVLSLEEKQQAFLDEQINADFENSRLIIPKILVSAPIVWSDGTDEKSILQDLQNGIAHYASSPMPNESGNAIFYGHSSNYLGAPGNYNDVFALLEKLESGDRIYITNADQIYTYEVINSKVVSPGNDSALKKTGDKMATFITCVPIGTRWKRLLVEARQLY